MSKHVTAAQIASELQLPPKRVRAILRKLEYQHDGRWKFLVSEKAAIKAAIKESRKRPAKAAAPKKSKAAKRTTKQPAVEVEHATMH